MSDTFWVSVLSDDMVGSLFVDHSRIRYMIVL